MKQVSSINFQVSKNSFYEEFTYYLIKKTAFKTKSWQRPTFTQTRVGAIIGAGGLNFCVRDGNKCTPTAKATKILP